MIGHTSFLDGTFISTEQVPQCYIYIFFMLQMDVRYKNIQSSAYTISILFGGIFIADVCHRVLIDHIYHSHNEP